MPTTAPLRNQVYVGAPPPFTGVGVKVTGVTVHFVDEGTDTGPVIIQRAVEIPANWDRDELETAIHAVEHQIYPEAIGMIARGEVRIAEDEPRKVIVEQRFGK